jgi:hypothetical protein
MGTDATTGSGQPLHHVAATPMATKFLQRNGAMCQIRK